MSAMKVFVDRDLCEAYGQCQKVAPEVFKVDDADVMHVLVEKPEGELLEKAQIAVRRCPKRALALRED